MCDLAEAEMEDLVRGAIQASYSEKTLDSEVEYVDVHYLKYDHGTHLLRARAPSHDLLGYNRWMVVKVRDKTIHIRGDGHASPTDFYVRATFEG